MLFDGCFVLSIVFLFLKLFGIFKSSWLWAASPIWIPFVAKLIMRVFFFAEHCYAWQA